MELAIIIITIVVAIGLIFLAIFYPIKKVSKEPTDKPPEKTDKSKRKPWNKRFLLWVALVIAAAIAVRPMYWLGLIGFAGLMITLAVFVGLVITYLLSLKKGSIYREIGLGVLIIITVCSVILLKFSAPELSANEIKSELNAASAEYRGNGIWKIKVVQGVNTFYLYYDENTHEVKRW